MTASAPLHRRAATFGLLAALASTFGQSIFIGLFGGPIQSALQLQPAHWGALYGLATGASGMLMFWLGAMADRMATGRAITIALCILACGAVTMALAQGPVMLVLAFFCLRLGGQGLCSHLAIVTAARHAHLRGRNIAIAAFGFILGEALLPLVVTALMVLSTAASPPLLGHALQVQTALTLLAGVVAVYALTMPLLMRRWIGPAARPMAD